LTTIDSFEKSRVPRKGQQKRHAEDPPAAAGLNILEAAKKRPTPAGGAPGSVAPIALSAATQKRVDAMVKATKGTENGANAQTLRALQRDVQEVAVEKMNKWEKREHDRKKWLAVVGREPEKMRHHRRVAQGILGKKHERAVKTYKALKERGLEAVNPNERRRVERHQEKRRKDAVRSFGTNLGSTGVGRLDSSGALTLSGREVREFGRRERASDTKLQSLSRR
jgi:hypothetical protein